MHYFFSLFEASHFAPPPQTNEPTIAMTEGGVDKKAGHLWGVDIWVRQWRRRQRQQRQRQWRRQQQLVADININSFRGESVPIFSVFVFKVITSEYPLLGLSFGQFTHKLSWLGYAKSLDNCQILKIQSQHIKVEALN